jgi:hypothetical protein
MRENLPWIQSSELSDLFMKIRAVYRPVNWVFATAALAANATVTVTQQVGIESWYLCAGLSQDATGAFTFQLTENESGNMIYPAAVINTAGAGTGGQTLLFAEPWMIRGTITATLTDTSAAVNNIWLAMIGIEVYPRRAEQLAGY